MQPWIIEELWRKEEDERERREQRHREQIQIDTPSGEIHDDQSREDESRRGVLIIEL